MAESGTISEATYTIALSVPYGTDVTALVPAITISGASVSPASGVAENFTIPVTYTVTAADGSSQAYTVTVTILPDSAKAVTGFAFTSPSATGTISAATHTIALNVPYGTNVTALVPTITITGASVAPASGVAQDFTHSVTYTVMAADGSSQAYAVTVTILPDSAKAITGFAFTSPSATGTISAATHTIALNVSYGTNVTALVPTITITGASVAPPRVLLKTSRIPSPIPLWPRMAAPRPMR